MAAARLKQSPNEPLPYFKWFVRDYRANRRVQRMGYVARGIYRELLDEEWLEGSLPHDITALADICECPLEVMEKAWPEISPCFQEIDGRLINIKLESMRTELDKTRIKRVESGRLGGIAKHVLASAKHVPEDAKQVAYSRAEQRREEGPEASAKHVPAFATEETEGVSFSMVTSGVLDDLQLAGMELRVVLDDVCRMAMKAGSTADDLRTSLVSAWREYEQARPKLSYQWGAKTFFGEGHWRNSDGWPWKEGLRPTRIRPIAQAKPDATVEDIRAARTTSMADIRKQMGIGGRNEPHSA
jgi:hypothetical protein